MGNEEIKRKQARVAQDALGNYRVGVLGRDVRRQFRVGLVLAHGHALAVAARGGEEDHGDNRDDGQHDEREHERHAAPGAGAADSLVR